MCSSGTVSELGSMPSDFLPKLFRIAHDLTNTIGIRVTEGALRRAHEMRCPWMVEIIDPVTLERSPLNDCLGLFGLFKQELLGSQMLQKCALPVINLSNRWGPVPGLGNFLSDDEAIGNVAAGHLLERGYRHFLVVGETEKTFVLERINGFRTRLGPLGASRLKSHLKAPICED